LIPRVVNASQSANEGIQKYSIGWRSITSCEAG
jgi:hypothetical protein